MKRFAAFDIDGTLVRWQLYHAVANKLAQHELFTAEQVATINQTLWEWKNRTHSESFHDYEMSLVTNSLKAMVGLEVEKFNQAVDAVFTEYKDQVYTYTRDLARDLKKQGYLLFAISGSQTEVVKKIADYYDFDDYLGTTFMQKNGQFTGEAITAREAKDKALDELIKKHHASYEDSIAVGDSLSDIPMLEAVEKPIAFNPEQKLADYARREGWDIVVERKNTIYELKRQGDDYILA